MAKPKVDVAWGHLIAAVSQMQNNGRYQADGTTHRLLFKLYSSGIVVSQMEFEDREGKKTWTTGRKKHNLSQMMVGKKPVHFAEEWARMYRPPDWDRLNPYQLSQFKEEH